MSPRIFLLCLGLMLAGAGGAWGQTGSFGQHRQHQGFHDRLLEIKRSQLGSVLGVNQQTVNQLLAIDQRYKPMRHQLISGMKNDWHRLQELMRQARPPEAEVKTLLNTMRHKRVEMLQLQQRQGDEEMALLTPVQQARYLMYLRSLIKEARSIKSGPQGGPMPGTPGAPPREIPVSRPPR